MQKPTNAVDSAAETTAAWAPLGAALADYHRGDIGAEIVVTSDLWEDEPTPVAAYYRPSDRPLPELEQLALGLCRGRVLDLGAGAGRHALDLQDTGLEVVALDLLPEAVEIMRDRGVHDPRVGGLEAVSGETFDTVLMLMHGLGVVGDIRGLGCLLEVLPGTLAPGGRLICDSADLGGVLAVESPELLSELATPDRTIGEVTFGLRYRDLDGRPYPWLFIDPEQLGVLAGSAGWELDVVGRGDRGAYLAVLSPGDAPIFTRP